MTENELSIMANVVADKVSSKFDTQNEKVEELKGSFNKFVVVNNEDHKEMLNKMRDGEKRFEVHAIAITELQGECKLINNKIEGNKELIKVKINGAVKETNIQITPLRLALYGIIGIVFLVIIEFALVKILASALSKN